MPPVILILCLGNICRSPMAEAILRHLLDERRIRTEVLSRGIAAPVGRRPHRHAVRVCAARGTPIAPSKHAALLTAFEVKIAARVLVMEDAHAEFLASKYPQAEGKTFRLDHFHPAGDIADPVSAPIETFEEIWERMYSHCTDWADALAAEQRRLEGALS